MEYGCITFGGAAKTHILKLERIQYRAIRICLGSMMSTHTGSLEVMAGIKPLKLRYEELNLRYLIKSVPLDLQFGRDLSILKNLKPNNYLVKCYNTITELDIQVNIDVLSSVFEIKDYLFVPLIDLSLHTELQNISDACRKHLANSLFRDKVENVPFDNLYFTDGSKFQDAVGFGIYSETHRLSFKLESPASIFCAEAFAIYKACTIIEKLSFGFYMICSDSMSTLKALSSCVVDKRMNSIVLQIKQLLGKLHSMGYVIKLLWVPAHCGIHGNEAADDLAKTGATIGDVIERNIPYEEYFPKVKNYVQNKWQQSWSQDDLGRLCYSILPKISNKPWFSQFDLSRNLIKNMSRLTANHFCLSSHLFRIGLKESNICECGRGYEDFDHVLWHCEKYDDHRRELTDELRKYRHSTNISIRDVLGSKNIEVLVLINKFINKAKITL